MLNIYAIHFNRPDFVQLQKDSIDFHLREEHRLTVVNNATDGELRDAIASECRRLGVEFLRTESVSPLAGLHHAQALDRAWRELIHPTGGRVLILDGDMFMLAPFEFANDDPSYAIYGYWQARASHGYLAPNFLFMDLRRMSDASGIQFEGTGLIAPNGERIHTDTGGSLHFYLRDHPEVVIRTVRTSGNICTSNENLDMLPDVIRAEYEDEMLIQTYAGAWLHYSRSSNWDRQADDLHARKSRLAKRFVYGTIDGSIRAVGPFDPSCATPESLVCPDGHPSEHPYRGPVWRHDPRSTSGGTWTYPDGRVVVASLGVMP